MTKHLPLAKGNLMSQDDDLKTDTEPLKKVR